MTNTVNSLAVQKHEELYVLEEPDRKNGPNPCSEWETIRCRPHDLPKYGSNNQNAVVCNRIHR